MTIIEIGTTASALIAIITLITKLYHLIATLQKLMATIHYLEQQVVQLQQMLNQLIRNDDRQEQRILTLEVNRERGQRYAA